MIKHKLIKLLAALLLLMSFNGCSFGKSNKVDYAFLVGDNYLGHIKFGDIVYSYNKDNTAYLLCSTKKGISKLNIKNEIEVDGITYPVTKIFDNALKNCTKIKEITLPNSIKQIGNNSFANCSSLNKVAFNSGLEKIGNYAFENCSLLNSVTLPNTLSSIGNYPFKGCLKLDSINVMENNHYFKSLDGVLYTIDNSLKLYPVGRNEENYRIEDFVSSISDYAFAFSKELKSINLNNVLNIGKYAFYNCDKLENIEFGSKLETIQDGAFSLCSSLHYVNIKNTVTSIGNSVFFNCKELFGLRIPNSVKKLGKDIIKECESAIFYINKDHDSFEWDSNWNSDHNQVYYNVTDDNVKIIDGICYQIQTKEQVGAIVIGHTKVIENIIIPNGINVNNYHFKVIGIARCSFQKDENIKFVAIGNNVRFVRDAAFTECKNLSELIISNCPATLEYDSFSKCSSLKKVTLGNNIQAISSGAFTELPLSAYKSYDNGFYLGNKDHPYLYLISAISKDIRNCDINQEAKIIADRAFYNCGALKSVTMYHEITFVGNQSFAQCNNLKAIYYHGTREEWGNLKKGSNWNYNCKELKNVDCDDGQYAIV